MTLGCPYGIHRVLEPKGVLPQGAQRLDNTMEIYDNEILVDVETLNIDSASFTQIREQAGDNERRMAEIMLQIVATRGKHHNPVTGSGGMFIGTVRAIGSALQSRDLKVGDRIASLVSLTLTPLVIKEIKRIHKDTAQVDIEGQAILFESGIYSVLPEDLPEKVALAVLDVAGVPRPGASHGEAGGGGAGAAFLYYLFYSAEKGEGMSGGLRTTTMKKEKVTE